MRGFRFRIALLTLGVVLGYGSAVMRWTGHAPFGRHGHCHEHDDHGHAEHPAAKTGI